MLHEFCTLHRTRVRGAYSVFNLAAPRVWEWNAFAISSRTVSVDNLDLEFLLTRRVTLQGRSLRIRIGTYMFPAQDSRIQRHLQLVQAQVDGGRRVSVRCLRIFSPRFDEKIDFLSAWNQIRIDSSQCAPRKGK